MINKTKIAFALAILTLGMNAQSGKLKKACIKMEKDENGVLTKIDTCVTAATDAELKQKLAALNLGEMPDFPEVPTVPGVPPFPPEKNEDNQSITVSKTIIIDDGEDDNNKDSRRKVKVVSSNGDNDQVIVMDEAGKIISSSANGTSAYVVVKNLKKGEKLDPETEKILKQNNISINDGGEGKQIVIYNAKTKGGKESKDVNVYIYKKVDVQNLSDADKKQLPSGLSESLNKAVPFTHLSIAPNPTDDACSITYQSTAKEPLQIKVYDTNGRTVYTETDKNTNEQINKTISLKSLGEGTYFVHLIQGKQSEVRKIIVTGK